MALVARVVPPADMSDGLRRVLDDLGKRGCEHVVFERLLVVYQPDGASAHESETLFRRIKPIAEDDRLSFLILPHGYKVEFYEQQDG